MASLDTRIDDLYQLPLSEFTPARNALVNTVRGADATHVRKLAKPTVVAWAVNQVYWQARAVYERLMKAGDKLRHAQIAALTGKNANLREAGDAHRRALGDAVKEAERIGAAAGSHPAPDALMRTFEALSLAKEPPAQPGRLTDALQPAGFEALAGVAPHVKVRLNAVAPKPDTSSTREGRSVRLEPDHAPTDAKKLLAAKKKEAAEAKRRAAEERKRGAAIRKAEAALERAKAKMRAAEETLKRTQARS